VDSNDLDKVASQLSDAFDAGALTDPITSAHPSFGMDDAYAVLDRLAAMRRGRGWSAVGRKIGFTNRTIWELYKVDRPFWAHVWDHTLVDASTDAVAEVAVGAFRQPRIEPEVVFGLRGPVPVSDDASEILAAVEWMAPGFEIVQCPYDGWRFTIAECAAAFGLHGALVVGPRVPVAGDLAALAATLASFDATVSCGGEVVGRGSGANVLGSPALALAFLARVVASQPEYGALSAGEIITTGSLTDAYAIEAGQTWSSGYGALGLTGLTVTFS
jgi:2-oxo-3-hexenedioate decarboxylase